MTRPTQEHPTETGFVEAEDAGITVLSLFLFIGMLMAAGLAVDINNVIQSRTQLQGAADAAGHAALYARWRNSEADAKDKGIEIAELNMPTSVYGNVLTAADIEFGYWDPINYPDKPFRADATKHTAVQVTARREAAGNNGIGTFLMHFIGFDELDVQTVSVWDSAYGFCPPKENGSRGEGFFARGVIDIQSNNTYKDGFCIHSDSWVELQQGGSFEEGVTVSMPDDSDVVLPSSGLDPSKNPGLAEALTSQSMNLEAFFSNLDNLIDSYRDPYSSVNSGLISDTTVNYSKINSNVIASDIVPNAVNILDCKAKTLTIDNDVVLKDAVIITSCEVKFNSGAAIENAVLITTDTSDKAISAPSGLRIGATDFCDSHAGGATVISMGDFRVASGLEVYGSTVISYGDTNFTANANGIAGMQAYANGRIDASSNGEMGFCEYGPPDNFLIPVFRMVM